MKQTRSLFFLIVVFLAVAMLQACSDDQQQSVKCYTDNDCPEGQRCAGGACELIPDGGSKPCEDINDCDPGQYCDNGICAPIPDEPPADGNADDGGSGDGDSIVENDGGDEQSDQPPDEDLADFSRWNFSVAVRRGGTSGPASQCIDSINPAPNSGPVLGNLNATGGYTLGGTFRDSSGAALAGAKVHLLGDRKACLPAEITTDGTGAWLFYLPPDKAYDVEAISADGRVGHLHVPSLQSNTSQDISLPATQALHGGPLCTDCTSGSEVIAAGWTVEAWYHDGPEAGKLAHAGVLSTDQGFDIPLDVGRSYDWIAQPPQGGPSMPRQIVLKDACHLNNDYDCSNESEVSRQWLRVKPGHLLSGTMSAGGTGSPQSVLELRDYQDDRMEFATSGGTGGTYQLWLPVGSYDITAIPAPNAFESGAMLFYSPSQTVVADMQKDIPMALGQRVEVTGKLIDGGGNAIGDAQVVLIVNDTPMVEGSYAWCDPNPVSTQADGSFSVFCNLTP